MKSIFITFCVCYAYLSYGQSYEFKKYGIDEGVSSNMITCITQDSRGFMWFGTRNGLNRFDGTTFKTFYSEFNDSTSIGDNYIQSIFEDNYQKLWVGTNKGVFIYNPINEKFSVFPKLPQDEVRSICADRENNLWFVINLSLFKLNTINQEITKFNVAKNKSPILSISPNGTVWVGSDSCTLKRYNPSNNSFSNYILIPNDKKSDLNIKSIYPINDTSLLIGAFNQVLQFNTETLISKYVLDKNILQKSNQAYSIICQSESIYWIGTLDGLYVFDLKSGKVEIVQNKNSNPFSLSVNDIRAFCKDKEGHIWIGTYLGGINFYSKQLNQFQKYFPINGENSLNGNIVREIIFDKNQNLWVGTQDAGLNKIDRKTGAIKQFMSSKINGTIVNKGIYGLLADNNELWIGTNVHGLYVLDLNTEKIIRHYEASEKPNSLKNNFIITIYKTRKGKILIGTRGGLFEYNRKKDNFKSLSFAKASVRALLEDENGTLWVGENGINFQNSITGLQGSFNYNAKEINSIPNNNINNFFEDSKKNIWICTDGGLCKIEYSSKKIIRFIHEYLNKKQIFRVLEDNMGTLWVTTANGLVSMHPDGTEFKLYDKNNGLLSQQFNYNSGYKSKEGNLYFGTTKGMISFNPSTFTKNNYVPPVLITGLQINNQELNVNNSSRLTHAVPYTTDVTLPYDSSNITIEFAALSYSNPNKNAFTYKMEGLDKGWTFIKNNRKVYYSKLPPGDYVFKLKGSSAGEIWNPKETELKIHILPPLWANNWAYTLYAIIFFSILYTILRYYYSSISDKNVIKIKAIEIEKEREIHNVKIEFITNLTHEIRTPLTLIKLPVEKILNSIPSDSIFFENLTMINKNTNRLINLTSQILDFRKTEENNYSLTFIRTDINNILEELFAEFKTYAENKKIVYTLKMPRVSLLADVDPEAFRKILSNLFTNALKYSKHNVGVRLFPFSSEDTVFKIEFKNDGFIIPYEQKDKIFEPFFRLKQTEQATGTGIGLTLSRSLADLHNGILDLIKTEDNFNIFLLTIPILQENKIKLNTEKNIETKIQSTSDSAVEISQNNEKKFSILLVEDNEEIIDYLQKELKSNYNIFKAKNGEEALAVLFNENINIIISDIIMPIMDGMELCKRIKTDLDFSHIPIILLTAKNTLTSKIEGLETGADAYIEKPFVMEYLFAKIKNLLSNRNIVKEYYAHSPLAHIKGIAYTKADKSFLEELQKIIIDNITERDLDVDTLSKMMNMSRATFYRKIKGLSDLTPNELITLSRLKKAAELLANGNHRINEVSNIVGYSHPSNFTRDFNKQFNISPSNYISNLKKE